MCTSKFLVSVSALALLAATATTGISQTPSPNSVVQNQQKSNSAPSVDTPGRGDAPARKAPGKSQGKDISAQRDREPAPKASDRAEEKVSPKSRVQGRETTPKASERAQEKASPKSAVKEQSQSDSARGKRANDEKTKNAPRQSNKGQSKGTDQSADEKGVREKRDNRGDRVERERVKDRATGGAATRNERDARDRSGRGESGSGSRDRVQLSEQKRSSIRERITKSGPPERVTNVNFDVHVGATVPRRTTLHVLPPDVVEIVPEYRDYRYVYVRDEIVIINPRTYTVAAVIDGGSRRSSSRPATRTDTSIQLSADDRAYIRRVVDLGASVRLGVETIFVGMDLPDTVELRPLPEVVVERYPDLSDHRYFVYEGDVVLVEPQSREVALVIED